MSNPISGVSERFNPPAAIRREGLATPWTGGAWSRSHGLNASDNPYLTDPDRSAWALGYEFQKKREAKP